MKITIYDYIKAGIFGMAGGFLGYSLASFLYNYLLK